MWFRFRHLPGDSEEFLRDVMVKLHLHSQQADDSIVTTSAMYLYGKSKNASIEKLSLIHI